MNSRFIHLNVHSEYSVTESIIRIDALVDHAVKHEAPAVAVTDTGNLFAVVKLYQSATARGVKPVIGCELPVGNAAKHHSALFLCLNNTGYVNLMRLVSRAYDNRHSGDAPWAEYDWLAEYADGLVVLSGAAGGDIGAALLAGDEAEARKKARFWASTFPERFYIEMQNAGRENDAAYLPRAFELAEAESLPAVATNRVCFLNADDFRVHNVRVCIARGDTLDDSNRANLHTEEQYFKSGEEMKALFAKCPEAIENSYEIAKRCTVNLELGKVLLPAFPISDGESPDSVLRAKATAGLEACLGAGEPHAKREVYERRLQHELEVISKMTYAGYFLIVAEFVLWAREQGIPVGPGRGSGAGSLVAYALGITEIDPVKYKLLFERFLNPERISMPDFDIDFCTEQRDMVIDHVSELYGEDRVSQIITFGSMAARAVVRDVGRVFGCPYSMMDEIAKLIPLQLDIKLKDALAKTPELKAKYDKEPKVHEVIDISLELEGLVRNVGCHAGGVVISPDPLTDHSALYRDPGTSSSLLTHLDMNDLERVGLVKFDFLGLSTLTIIEKTLANMRARGIETPPLKEMPLDDPETYKLLGEGRTTAVFQLESEGVRRLLRRLKPNCFDDIVAVLALYRPGPLQSGMVDDFIQRKRGAAEIVYPHPKLEPVLKPTCGVIIYQEQVMEIAQILAGYTMGNADILRRAMGKKKPEEMAKQRKVFVNNAVERGVKRRQATEIFDLMEKFAGYGFNKSHSVAYALVAYQTAWLKAHYGAFFMAATMSFNHSTDKLVSLIHECRSAGIKVEPPDINLSGLDFTVEDDKRIRYGFGAIRTLGRKAMQSAIEERKAHGDYASMEDFCSRAAGDVRRNMLNTLVRSGALDSLDERAAMLARMQTTFAMASQSRQSRSAGQDDLFTGELSPAPPESAAAVEPLPEDESIKMEKEALGLYIRRHPMDQLRSELRGLNLYSLHQMKQIEESDQPRSDKTKPSEKYRTAGVITQIRQRRGKRGAIVLFTLDDNSGRLEFLLGGKAHERCKDLLGSGKIVMVEATHNYDPFRERGGWRAENVQNLDDMRRAHGKRLAIVLDADRTDGDFCAQLKNELERFKTNGKCPVYIDFHRVAASARIQLGKTWEISPCDEVVGRLKRIEGVKQVEIKY